jgi:copper chaperone CopZ
MTQQGVRVVLLGCPLMVALMVNVIEAASPARVTTITVKMENENCAKRITAALREVPNVGDVRADIARQIATVNPAGLRSPSARALWEAVEKTGHAVIQLQGPQGKFTSKPEN